MRLRDAPPPAPRTHALRRAARVGRSATCGPKQEEFIQHCFYCAGQYDDAASFRQLSTELGAHEAGRKANRIFYLSVPPSIFVAVAQNAARCASSTSGARARAETACLLAHLRPPLTWHHRASGYTRVIVEKPFGRDLESSRALGRGLAEALTEEQVYRIDHYLGKELIENLTVLRFSNLVFQPLWNRQARAQRGGDGSGLAAGCVRACGGG